MQVEKWKARIYLTFIFKLLKFEPLNNLLTVLNAELQSPDLLRI